MSDFELYSGSEYFDLSIKTDVSIDYNKIKNIFFFNRKFLWQKGAIKNIKHEGTIVLELNPRIISNWWLLLVRKLTGKQTVLWGHAWPRKGHASKTDFLRNMMRKLASQIIVYTNQQKNELKKKMPNKHIVAAPNALFYSSQMISENHNNPNNILYVGRLVKDKKPFFLVKAFERALADIPTDTQLKIVGDGVEKIAIANFIEEKGLSKRVKLLGHINDFSELKKLYKNSICSVSPGYVGLSITQSFGFGVPMIISKDENHSPEIEAAVDGVNSVFFKTDDLVSFRESLLRIFDNKKDWVNKRASICDRCKQNYSVEAMVSVFCTLAHKDG